MPFYMLPNSHRVMTMPGPIAEFPTGFVGNFALILLDSRLQRLSCAMTIRHIHCLFSG